MARNPAMMGRQLDMETNVKQTIKSLQAELEESNKREADSRTKLQLTREQKQAAEAAEKETREQFADLKKRLHESEMEVARLSGYMARVREDDTVREDLITVGEPDGEQRLVPKRRNEFDRSRPFSHEMHDALHPQYDQYGREKKRRHWIEY